jgi:site-specific DNA recombinase
VKNGAVIYCRVSTEEQVDNNSLPVQRRECQEKAEKLGCDVLEVFTEEGVSGAKQERPAMARMLVYCAANKDRVRYVIVKDIDRFSRDVLVYHALRAQFRALEIVLYSVNQPNIAEGTAESRLLEAMFSGISQYERDKILQRTLAGTKEVIAKGGWTCYAPYGYRTHRTSDNVPTLAVVPEEAECVSKAFELFAGGMRLLDVTRRLNELGYKTKRGARLSFQSVYNWLRCPVYVGKVRSRLFPDRLIDGRHPAIIPAELWDRVQGQLGGRKPKPTRHKFSPDFVLTGTLLCGACDAPMTGSFSRSHTGRLYGYYHCRKARCRFRNLPKDSAETNFLTLLTRIGPTPDWLDDYEQVVMREWHRRRDKQVEEDRRYDKHLADLESRRSRIEDAYFDGKVGEEAYQRNLKRVEEEIAAIGAAREQLGVSEEKLRMLLASSRLFFTRLSNSWDCGFPERKRRVQRLVFPEGLPCGGDGLYRTASLPPTLAIFEATNADRSSLVTHVRTSWNSLLAFMQSIADLMENAPASAADRTKPLDTPSTLAATDAE